MEGLDPFAKAEGRLDDARIVIQPIDRKNGIMSVQVVGNEHTPEQLDAVVAKLHTVFGGEFEMPDHPGTSHIRVGKITSTLKPSELVAEIVKRAS